MAGEEVAVARLGAWVARALGETGDLAIDLDTDGLGLQMPDAIVSDPAVTAAGRALAEAAAVLRDGADLLDAALDSGDTGELVRAFVRLFEGLYRYVDAAIATVNAIDARARTLPTGERDAVVAFGLLLAKRLIDYFIVDLLDRQLPRLAFLFRLLGLVEKTYVEAAGGEPEHLRRELRLDRVKDLITDPATHFANVYHWGTTQFDPYDIMRAVLVFYQHDAAVQVGKVGDDAFLEIGPFRWSRDSSASPPGLMLDASLVVDRSFSERAELTDEWGLGITTDVHLGGGLIVRLRPPFDISAQPKEATVSGAVKLTLDRNPGAPPLTIVGGNPLIQLTVDNVAVGGELTVGASTSGVVDINPGVFAQLSGLTVTLGSQDADNFLATLLASADVQGSFDLGLSWHLKEGLVVTAAGGLEIAIPMHQSLGFVTFETLYIILRINTDGSLSLETSAAITGRIGPLSASVDRMGAIAKVAFSNAVDQSLGPVDLSLDFKPPSGVGLAIDAGVVRGGGYLWFDTDKGEYAGALELVFAEFLALRAIGLVTTKLPDGSPGFSLLVIITAEFGTPIQLGFGFTLIGVGGLLGLNRTMKLEELAEGVRSGSVENVMFPHDVVANAPQIISDLKRFFPEQPDRFLIGPMAKLGWGSPSLVTATLGVIVEVPPGNIAILGVLKCALPDEETALLVLQVKFIGALEVDKSRLWFFASLYGSRVLFITISGDLALLIAWGHQPEFILSVGGFHPKYSPPPTPFPVPQRLTLSILDTDFARITVQGYFAVTSNTVQFGAAVDLFFGVDVFSIEGHLGFDALFQFSPFYFIVSLSASLSVKVFGIGLFGVRIRGELSGTSPWHIEGEGSICILFFEIGVPFALTWGEDADTVVPGVEALPIIRAELEKRENWVALTPTGTRLSVILRELDPATALVLHPLAVLRISQRAVPLELTIQKIGSQRVTDIDRASVTVSSPGLVVKAPAYEPFATAQFRDLDAADRLSAPGYERQVAGVEVSVAEPDTRTAHAVKRVVLHELVTIDTNYKRHLRRFVNLGKVWFDRLLSSNATARSARSTMVKSRVSPFPDTVRTDQPGFAIASLEDNVAHATFGSHATAQDALATFEADPAAAGRFHVIPAAEASTR